MVYIERVTWKKLATAFGHSMSFVCSVQATSSAVLFLLINFVTGDVVVVVSTEHYHV